MARKSTPRAVKLPSTQAFTRKILAWYARAARDLPWRKTRDPYRVAVSEFMLQQTQVARVMEFYPRFLKRFPTLEKLARARPKAVREAWDGLGYYARASNLHALAKQVARRHDGTLPETPEDLQKLPGVGPYTAGAIATFAYEKPVAAVDTNVRRVIKRVFWGEVRSGDGGEIGAEERQASLEVQSGDDGAGGACLHGAEAEVPRVPGVQPLQDLRCSSAISAPCPQSAPRFPIIPQATRSRSASCAVSETLPAARPLDPA